MTVGYASGMLPYGLCYIVVRRQTLSGVKCAVDCLYAEREWQGIELDLTVGLNSGRYQRTHTCNVVNLAGAAFNDA